MKGVMWNPWHGCRKCSEGCLNCWLYRIDGKYERDTSKVVESKTTFCAPLKKDRSGNYKIQSGTEVGTCFSSDFFIEDADGMRDRAWAIMKQRPDLTFFIPTKRISRIESCLPKDWGDGYDNVLIAVSAENQARADERLPYLLNAPIKRRGVLAAPLLERVDLSRYLRGGKIDMVSAAGESYAGARECRYEWILDLREQCLKSGTAFEYHQTGSNFVKDGKRYKIPHGKEYAQAKKAGLDLPKNAPKESKGCINCIYTGIR